ncbi:MAG: penicillin acylase family protein, partial [Rhodospirillaceae bacterium]|nr:penicillin acylase family protein [Rhodospirillaceae bacterium]
MKIAFRIAAGLIGLGLGTALGIAGWLVAAAYLSLPQADGRLALSGLAAPVTVARDGYGIPRIAAASHADAYFALGFVHAQDRLFQMELMRRTGQGRLAEVIGRPG